MSAPIKPRRAYKVTPRAPMPDDAMTEIRPGSDGIYRLYAGETIVAECGSAKRLSDYGLEEGAREVKCAFNWALADGEA